MISFSIKPMYFVAMGTLGKNPKYIFPFLLLFQVYFFPSVVYPKESDISSSLFLKSNSNLLSSRKAQKKSWMFPGDLNPFLVLQQSRLPSFIPLNNWSSGMKAVQRPFDGLSLCLKTRDKKRVCWLSAAYSPNIAIHSLMEKE